MLNKWEVWEHLTETLSFFRLHADGLEWSDGEPREVREEMARRRQLARTIAMVVRSLVRQWVEGAGEDGETRLWWWVAREAVFQETTLDKFRFGLDRDQEAERVLAMVAEDLCSGLAEPEQAGGPEEAVMRDNEAGEGAEPEQAGPAPAEQQEEEEGGEDESVE